MKIRTVLIFSGLIFLGFLIGGCPPDRGGQELDLCTNFEKDEGELGVDCGGPCAIPCHDVVIENELLIKHLEVVNSSEATNGDLSFGKLMERLTPSGTTTKEFILSLLTTWDNTHTVNGRTINPRQGVTDAILNRWKTNDGVPTNTSNDVWNMNLANAPFHLLGITNRVDLQDVANESAGEGRLTFGLDHQNKRNDFTIIFEYGLRGKNQLDVVRWAKRWHQLSAFDKDSPKYLDTLVNIIRDFSGTPASLNQIRTNEVIGGISDGTFMWELREFNIAGNQLREVSRKQSPDQSLDNSPLLREYILDHQQDILSGQHKILTSFNFNGSNTNFLAGNTLYEGDFKWEASGFGKDSPESNKLTAMSCTGCHGGLIDDTEFTHIKPRGVNDPSGISTFLVLDSRSRRDSIGKILEQELQPLPDLNLFRINALMDSATVAAIQNQIMNAQNILEEIKGIKRVH